MFDVWLFGSAIVPSHTERALLGGIVQCNVDSVYSANTTVNLFKFDGFERDRHQTKLMMAFMPLLLVSVVPKQPQIKLMSQKLWAPNDKNDQIDEQMYLRHTVPSHVETSKVKCMIHRVFVCIHTIIYCYAEFVDECSHFEMIIIFLWHKISISYFGAFWNARILIVANVIIFADVNQIFKRRTAQWISLEIHLTHFSLNFPNVRHQNALPHSCVECE